MGGAHGDHLFVHAASPLHRLAPQCKIASLALFVFAVVATRREQFWAFALFATFVVALAVLARIPGRSFVRRLAVELPFVAFALLLPFVAGGPRRDVGPFSLSVDGLWGAWNVLAKGTLGVGAALVLTAATTIPDLIRGLERLRMPSPLVAVLTFMVRYLDVVGAELRRMRIARISRGHDPRWWWQARIVAISAGAVFVRSYERGERVFLAMQARGYVGVMPSAGGVAATARSWALSLTLPAIAATVAVASWA